MDVSLSLNMTILPSLCTSCTQATSTHFFRRVLCVILTKSDLAEAKSDLGRIQYFLGSFTTYLFPTSLRLRRTGGFRMTWGEVFGFTMMNSAKLMKMTKKRGGHHFMYFTNFINFSTYLGIKTTSLFSTP